jgi:hypothetical protein
VRALLFALLAWGCAARVDLAVATHEREQPSVEEPFIAECHIIGAAKLDPGVGLFAGRDLAEPYAHFNSATSTLDIHDVPALLVDRVGTRVRTTSGFTFDGWMERSRLSFSARGRIPIADNVAWIPQGETVTLKVGQGKNVLIAVPTKRLAPVEAIVPCERVAIGSVPPARPLELVGDMYTLKSDRIAVSPARGAPPTFTLRAKPGVTLYVSVEDRGDGMLMRFSDGIEVEGWVDREALGPVAGFGMIGCGGCGVGYSHGFLRPKGARIAKVRRTSPVFVGEKMPSPARGTVIGGTDVIVVEQLSGYARVLPNCQDIMPSGTNAFFVSRADLEVGDAIEKVTLPSCH